MPINKKQFDTGLTQDMIEWMKSIHEFLFTHKESAYTEEEVWQLRHTIRPMKIRVVEEPGPFPRPEEPKFRLPAGQERKVLGAALAKLAELNAVETKLAGGLRHYIYKQELPQLE